MKQKNQIRNKYFFFLLRNIFKKKSIWIIGFLYLFVYLMHLYIIPISAHTSPFITWSNSMFSVQAIASYISVLFSSLLVLAIYKNFRDDGTELLIVSKPISRKWMLSIKATVFIITSIIMSITSAFICIFVFLFGVSAAQVWSLIICVFATTFISLMAFGGITLIVSIYLNKIWVILFSLLICAASNIYYVIIEYATVSKTPIDKLLANNDTSVNTFHYMNSDGKTFSEYSYFVSESDMSDPNIWEHFIMGDDTLSFIESEQAKYSELNKSVGYKAANCFNTTTHFHQMGNALALKDVIIHGARKAFGSNRNMNYSIKNSFIMDKFATLSDDFPIMFIDYDGVDYLPNSFNLINCVKWIEGFSFANENVYTVGTNVSQTNAMGKMTTAMDDQNDYCMLVTYPDSRGNSWFAPSKLKISDNESKFFDALLLSDSPINFQIGSTPTVSLPEGLLIGQNTETIKPFVNVNGDSTKFINSNASFNFNSPAFVLQGSPAPNKFTNFNEYVHFALLNNISIGSGETLSLNIQNNEQLMFESLKFKYYILMYYVNNVQKQFLNIYLNYYANANGPMANDHSDFGPMMFPFVSSGDMVNFISNGLFYNPEYIAVQTLVKNYSFIQDTSGYGGRYLDGSKYLDPYDYTLRKGGNIGNILINKDNALMTNFFGFSFNTSLQIPTDVLYILYIIASVALFGIGYVIYNRIDFK